MCVYSCSGVFDRWKGTMRPPIILLLARAAHTVCLNAVDAATQDLADVHGRVDGNAV